MQTPLCIWIWKGNGMIHVTSLSSSHRPAARNSGWFARLLNANALRKERRGLRHLTDAQLNDIGVTRAQAEEEASRSGWDAPNHWRR